MLSASQRAVARLMLSRRMTEEVHAGPVTDATDPTTGNPTETWGPELYLGPGRISYSTLSVQDSDRTAQVVSTQNVTLSIPSSATRLPKGTHVRILGSTADAGLVGRRYIVDGAPTIGQTTAHRYPLIELS